MANERCALICLQLKAVQIHLAASLQEQQAAMRVAEGDGLVDGPLRAYQTSIFSQNKPFKRQILVSRGGQDDKSTICVLEGAWGSGGRGDFPKHGLLGKICDKVGKAWK